MVICTVPVEYMTRPFEVFEEMGDVVQGQLGIHNANESSIAVPKGLRISQGQGSIGLIFMHSGIGIRPG